MTILKMISFNSFRCASSICRSSHRYRMFSQTNTHSVKVISGIQPTGVLHLGNYFGAIRKWIELQQTYDDVSFFVADLHAITMPPNNPVQLRKNRLEIIATLLACGIDPNKSLLFANSDVPQHAELCWILSCFTTMARLSKLPQFKEKSANVRNAPTGLFIYPVLQAADIMVHKATLVPCGDDQTQQLQFAQYIAKKFNKTFGHTFPPINELIANDPSARIRSFRDPTKKQSKSDPEVKSRITLLDTPDVMLENIKKALTDCKSEVTYEPEKRPGIANLLTIHSLIVNKTVQEICDESQHINTGQYKLIVADAVIAHFSPIRTQILEYLNNLDYLSTIMAQGAEKARASAQETIDEVKQKVGFR